jgi:fructose-1,6-bisphosphatase/inositol monophosphatase family enzyme
MTEQLTLGHLEKMFNEVRQYLLTRGRQNLEIIKKNPRGDLSREFDLKAEEIAIEFCRREFDFPVRILTEERGEVLTKEGKPRYVFVIDPVDGSTNFKHGVEASAFSIAAIPAEEQLMPQNAKLALIGFVFSGRAITAEKGKGAFDSGKKTRSSEVKEIEKAFVNIDLDFDQKEKIARVLPLMKKVYQIRRNGSAAMELALVATGGFDAHVDVRDKLSPENFMAAYLIIGEAGGIITDAKGAELPAIKDLKKPFNIIASGNVVLHKKIIDLIEWE